MDLFGKKKMKWLETNQDSRYKFLEERLARSEKLLAEQEEKINNQINKLSSLINLQQTQHSNWLTHIRKTDKVCEYLGIELEPEINLSPHFIIKKKKGKKGL